MAIHFVILTILSHLNAVELSTLCNGTCDFTTPQSEITNSSIFTTNNQIKIQTQIQSFINYGTIKSTNSNNYAITIHCKGNYIANFYNYGRIETAHEVSLDTAYGDDNSGYKNIYNYGFISGYISLSSDEKSTTHITNYGEMGGVKQNNGGKPIVIENYGVINPINNGTKAHFSGINLTIKNYAMLLSESASAFNAFNGNGTNPITNSHLVLNGSGSVKFADKNSRLILDFGNGFEFGKGYLFSKLVTDTSGNNKLIVDFSSLTTKSSLYKLTQSGENFIVSLDAPNSEIGILNKSNVRTMNNFLTMSNSMIYPRKHNFVILRERSDRRIPKNISSLRADSQNLRGNPPYENIADSAFSLKSYESFSYRNEAQTHRIKRPNKRNYSRSVKDSSLRASANERGNPQNQRFSQNPSQNPHDYYFILTPFINHNYFFQSGRYNLSGFDYGFLTAFSARVAESNSLGAHFMMSYGTLGDSHDKNFNISNLNLNLGLNYKLDLVYDMYLKARGDFFYFLNQVKTLTMINAIKPNNLGFGVSIAYGKDFDFKQGGILGIEGGINYKALSASKITLDSMSETYQQSLYHLLYADLGISYTKYFGNFGFNANLGIKGNITANKLAKSKISLNAFNRSEDMILDNDKVLGYANIVGSYVLNHKNFDTEFSLVYYGNYGDRIISNGGGFEWRVGW